MQVYGQIKINRLTEREAFALNLWFLQRHYKHSAGAIEKMALSMEDNTLFGVVGEDGEFIIPNISKCLKEAGGDTSLVYQSEEFKSFESQCGLAEGGTMQGKVVLLPCFLEDGSRNPASDMYNQTPGSCPSLWLTYRVYSPEGEDFSVLYWEGDDGDDVGGVYYDVEYIGKVLERMGKPMVEGTIVVQNEEGDDFDEEEGMVTIVFSVDDGAIAEFEEMEYDDSISDDATEFCRLPD